MNDRLAKAEAVFHEALELLPEQREGFLQRACGQDAELCREVAALLRASGVADRWLKDPANSQIGAALDPAISSSLPEGAGTVIGRYKLREKVGEGGCGVVYVAEQEEPVRRRVALKIIKLGMDTKAVVARFEAERQALAMMDHPNIAKVLDAGSTDTGRPYFVMELVRGVKITEYCDQHKVSTRERLELFIKVCQAVQHAHQKGIIHRDLKPSNILVTPHDGAPVPKVIDFGIAKATEGRLTDATVYTQLHQFIGTPAYMSPEQAEMSGLDIDTRTDIYSLGVLLYELLTGVTPFDAQTLSQSGLDEMRRIIREEEPKRPSTRLSTLDAAALTKHRQEKLSALVNLVRGDLDWIVMKCLEKDRTRRYETANGLAADLKRHLDHEPVMARPPSTAYWLQKAIRRNKLAFGAASAIGAALVTSLAIALVALAKERAANARAERQTRLANQRMAAALKHMESLLADDLPELRTLPGSTRPTERMLRRTLALMDGLAFSASDDPEFLLTSARIHTGLVWFQGSRWGMSLGQPDAALASASNAWNLLRAVPAGALPAARVHEVTYRAERASGLALEALGREDEALKHYERMLALGAKLDEESPRTGNRLWSSEARDRLQGLYLIKGQFDQIREHNAYLLRDPYLLTNTASDDLKRLGFTAGVLSYEGVCSMSASNWSQALDFFRQSLAFREACLKQSGTDHMTEYLTVITMNNIGLVLCEQRNYAEGLPMLDQSVRRVEALADRDKADWVFQDVLTAARLDDAKARVAAARAGVISHAECLRLLEQARTSYQRCLEKLNASAANPSRMKSWVKMLPGEVKQRLEEVEAAIAALKNKE